MEIFLAISVTSWAQDLCIWKQEALPLELRTKSGISEMVADCAEGQQKGRESHAGLVKATGGEGGSLLNNKQNQKTWAHCPGDARNSAK